MEKQFRISPSKIGMLLECERCLWLFFREGISRPEGIFPSLPGGMDGVFKKYFDSYRKLGKLPPEVDGKVNGRLFDDFEKLDVWRNNRKGLTSEFPEFNIFLKGAIDDLLVSPDGKYVPFDFKSRGYAVKEDTHKHYQHQLDLYSLLFSRNNLTPADYGYLLFFYPVEYDNQSARFITETVKMEVSPERGYDILKKVDEIIKNDIPSAHSECQYCQYRGIEIK